MKRGQSWVGARGERGGMTKRVDVTETIFACVRAPKTERRGDDRAWPSVYCAGVIAKKTSFKTNARSRRYERSRHRARCERWSIEKLAIKAPRRSKKHAHVVGKFQKPKLSRLREDAPGWRSPRHPAGGPVIRELIVVRDGSGESRVPWSVEGCTRDGLRDGRFADFPGGTDEPSPLSQSVSAFG